MLDHRHLPSNFIPRLFNCLCFIIIAIQGFLLLELQQYQFMLFNSVVIGYHFMPFYIIFYIILYIFIIIEIATL